MSKSLRNSHTSAFRYW